jgi:hypothetical protein
LLSAVHMGEPDWPWVESQLCSTTWLLGSSLWNMVRGQVVDHMVSKGLSSGKPVCSTQGRCHQQRSCTVLRGSARSSACDHAMCASQAIVRLKQLSM